MKKILCLTLLMTFLPPTISHATDTPPDNYDGNYDGFVCSHPNAGVVHNIGIVFYKGKYHAKVWSVNLLSEDSPKARSGFYEDRDDGGFHIIWSDLDKEGEIVELSIVFSESHFPNGKEDLFRSRELSGNYHNLSTGSLFAVNCYRVLD